MTEDELVTAIQSLLQCHPELVEGRVLLGIGDDAALWQPSRSHRSAISTDMLVESVHFTRDAMALEDAGWRAMAANLSDLAAMGARPVLATVALGVPSSDDAETVLELYKGIAAAAKRFDTAIAGGDLSRSDLLTICITVVGEVRASNVKTRAGALPGDVLAVTGPLGSARAGLELTRRAAPIDATLAQTALQAFRRPQPRLAEGRFLAASRNVNAMMDCSDGLSTDLRRLCSASGCGAILEIIPVAPAARVLAEALEEDPQRFAVAGGEDFELLIAVRPRAFAYVANRFAGRFGGSLVRVGVLSKGSAIEWQGAPLEPTGWDHFRKEV